MRTHYFNAQPNLIIVSSCCGVNFDCQRVWRSWHFCGAVWRKVAISVSELRYIASIEIITPLKCFSLMLILLLPVWEDSAYQLWNRPTVLTEIFIVFLSLSIKILGRQGSSQSIMTLIPWRIQECIREFACTGQQVSVHCLVRQVLKSVLHIPHLYSF